jgi:Ni/Co efflux regulator RcnB
MKKFILAAAAAAAVLAPVASATAAPAQNRYVVQNAKVNKINNRVVRQNRQIVRQNRQIVRQNQRIQQRQWVKGQRFDRRYAQNYRVVDYRQYRNQRLYAPPSGYQWHQSGNDAVLVSVATGLIGAVLGGVLFN